MSDAPFKKLSIPATFEQLRGREAPPAPTSAEQRAALNCELSNTDALLIGQITKRVQELFAEVDPKAAETFDSVLCIMDIAAVHCNGTPLKLLQLYMSGNDDFTHDVLGIGVHIDRSTGKLRNGFKPRFALPLN